ncbi:MAG: FG-GAP-like repeat-containing protein [Bacteroidales bacterium]|nr:FG-GAP-like repeat-containing protein [Bacteroidales bacterium]
MKKIFTLLLLLSAVITFAQPLTETIITGNFPNPAVIETVDFNQDGQEDIIVAGNGTIRWYENNNGDFVAHDILDSLNSIWDFDLIDFNGNTEIDIVAINDFSNTLFWLENDGSMNFTYHVLADTLVDLERVRAIDANQNGLVDVFFTVYSGGFYNMYMWKNTGSGFDTQFVDRADYRDIHLFDYHDDGDYDLLSKMNYFPFDTEEIGVVVNDGNNNFTDSVKYEHTGDIDISDVHYVDLDNDGDGDLVIVDHIQDELFWLENCETRHDILTGQAAFSLEVIDFDNDGVMDIVIDDANSDVVELYKGSNPGSSMNFTLQNTFDAGGDPNYFRSIDANQDALTDFVYIVSFLDEISVMFNQNSLDFDQLKLSTSVAEPDRLRQFDLDGDGDLDIVCFPDDEQLGWFELKANGTYELHTISKNIDNPHQLEVRDMNNDGYTDIITASTGDDDFSIWYNDGNQDFTEYSLTYLSSQVDNPAFFSIADFDNDGFEDFVIVSSSISSYNPKGVFWIRNEGDGTYSDPIVIEDDLNMMGEVVTHDFDGDGWIDIIVADGAYGNEGLKVYKNYSTLGFSSESPLSFKAETLRLGDINGDGEMDLITRNDTSNNIVWLESHGDLTFTEHTIPMSETRDVEFELCDHGNDGITDIFFYTNYYGFTNSSDFTAGILINDGSQNFTLTYFLQNTSNMNSGIAFDKEMDGDIDFFLAFDTEDKISFFENMAINLDNPEVTAWPTATDINYGQSLDQSVLSGGAAVAAGTFEFVNPLAIFNAGTHTVQVKFIPDDAATYHQAFGSTQVTVHMISPTVNNWPTASDIEYGQSLSESVLSGGDASVPGLFSFDNPSTVPGLGVYTADVTFTPDDAVNYTTVSGTVDVTVNQAIPTVSDWPTASAITYGDALSISTLSGGTASVTGTFSFDAPSTTPDVGIYTADVTFAPDDAVNYTTVSGTVDVTVNQVTPTITDWPSASAITYGDALSASTLSGGAASVTGTFSFDAPATTPVVGIYTADVTFTPDDVVNYTTVSGTIDLTVNQATPTVSDWPTASAITYGDALSASTLSGGTASVTGTFSFNAPATTPDIGTYTADVTFTPDDAVNYTTVSGTVDITVNQVTPTVSDWPTASAITYGDALSASTLSGGTASVTGTFSFDAPATTPDAGVYTADVTFTPDDVTNYTTVSGTVDVTVNQAIQMITWDQDLTALEIGNIISLTATASSGLTVTYESDNTDVAVISGNNLEIISSGIAVITAIQSGNANFEAAESVEKSLDIPVGILTSGLSSGLTIYPVPAQIFIKLETDLAGEKHYTLYDVSGSLISDGKFSGSEYELNIRKLTPGQYVIRITQGSKVLSGSFVKQ